MKTFYLLIIAFGISFSACRVKEGEAGQPGEGALNKQGSISGVLHYKMYNGNESETDSVIAPFSYEYFSSLQDNTLFYDKEDNYYEVTITRRESKESNSNVYIYFYGNLESLAHQPEAPDEIYVGFNATREVQLTNPSRKALFVFDSESWYDENDGENTGALKKITNFKLDTLGNLSFNYELIVPYNAISYNYRVDDDSAVVKGQVSVKLERSYYQNNNLKSAAAKSIQ